MECSAGRNKDIVVRVIDAQVGRIDHRVRNTLQQLSHVPAAVVNINENKTVFYQIQLMEMTKAKMRGDNKGAAYHKSYLDKFAKREPVLSLQLKRRYSNMRYDPEVLRTLYVKNSCVDILFGTCLFLQFLNEKLGRDSINNSKLLLSVYNIPKLDNAFFTGEYMVYGNGHKNFYPLSAIDVAAHELTHGLVQNTAGLEYKGHSGALNESFADVIATAFEFWLYVKFNTNADTTDDLQGEADWLLGEDIGKTTAYLRNLRDPTKADMPQPKLYKGQHWSNPNDTNRDHGGVHINSGISNHCFYLLSEKTNIDTALPIFYNCLLKLGAQSDFIDFRNTLVSCAPESLKVSVQKCLDVVGLTVNTVSDWDLSPAKNKIPKTNSEPQQSKRLSYPNSHIPYLRNSCCPHCLCLQTPDKLVRFTFEDLTADSSDEKSSAKRRKR
jgi:hypothetical protein